jgi:AcrR family transcriptional regulator
MPRHARAVAGRKGDPSVALREHLVAVAEELLAERQVSAITIRDIAGAADVSDGVLYNYFADKNDLLLTALVRRFSGIVERLHAKRPEPGSATVEANLGVFAAALLDLHTDALPIFGKLLTEPALLRRFMNDVHSPGQTFGGKQIRDPLVEYLAGEQKLGRIGAVDIEAAADLVVGAVATVALTGLLGAVTPAGARKRLSAIAATLVTGLEPVTSRRRNR